MAVAIPPAGNVFKEYDERAWPYKFTVGFRIGAIAGGIPSDPMIAESWIKTKIAGKSEEDYRAMVAQTMLDRNVTLDEAVAQANIMKNLNGFKRDTELGMYIEGRQVKAAMKEAVSVACASPENKLDIRSWGNTRKYLTNYLPEHVFVDDLRVYLFHASDHPREGCASDCEDCKEGRVYKAGDPFHEKTRVMQTFPVNEKTRQSGIQYTEVCEDVYIEFTVRTDHPFTYEEWAMIWLTGQYQGVGALRAMGMGVYEPVKFTQIRGPAIKKAGKSGGPKKKEAAGAGEDEED